MATTVCLVGDGNTQARNSDSALRMRANTNVGIGAVVIAPVKMVAANLTMTDVIVELVPVVVPPPQAWRAGTRQVSMGTTPIVIVRAAWDILADEAADTRHSVLNGCGY